MRVPKERARVHVRVRGGGRWEGEIFLSACSPYHDGPQSLTELLNEPDPFFPVRLPGGEVRLVGKPEVIVVSLPHAAADQSAAGPELPTWMPARLVLVEDETLEGLLNTSTAENRHPRVLDALNGPGQFVCLRDQHSVRVVRKDAIRWVVSPSQSPAGGTRREEVTRV
jgi:hypothetical protein